MVMSRYLLSRLRHLSIPPATTLSYIPVNHPINLIPISSSSGHCVLDRFQHYYYHHGKSRLDDAVILRDSCSCLRCVNSSTGQKLFETADIPLDIETATIERDELGDFHVKWRNDIPGYDCHSSTFTVDWVTNKTRAIPPEQNNLGAVKPASNVPSATNRNFWNREMMTRENLVIPFVDYAHSKEVLHLTLWHLCKYGMVYLSNVPSEATAIEKIASRIGPLRNTLYGSTWDVQSKPSPINIAYTSKYLGFHMDLLYMANPPGLQILHCMKASTEGGESLFTDSFRAVDSMNLLDPKLLTVFGSFPITYRYKNGGSWYQYTRTSIERQARFRTVVPDNPPVRFDTSLPNDYAINWSPPFQAPMVPAIDVDDADDADDAYPDRSLDVRLYLQGAKMFKKLIEADDAVFETKMEPGTCVIFDNRRILHARRAFSSGGERWLRGAYVDMDAYSSRLRVLDMELNGNSKR